MFELRKYTLNIHEMSKTIVSTYVGTSQGYTYAHIDRTKLQHTDDTAIYIVAQKGTRHRYDEMIKEAN